MNRELESKAKSSASLSRQVVERQAEEPKAKDFLSPHRDPLAQVTCRAGDASCAQAHASTLNRATDLRPSRSAPSLSRLQRQHGNRYVQRVLILSRKGEGEAEATPEIETAIQQARGSGQALDGGARAQMEPAFGADFSGVRVHADAQADDLNRSLNARAFTTGQDIFFRQGAYSPGSSSGQELLAHELTHVVQQRGDEVRRKLTLGQPGDRYEQEADRVARVVTQPAQPDERLIRRQVEPEEEEEEEEEEGPVQAKAENHQAQRQGEEEEEEEEGPLQAKAENHQAQRQGEEEEEDGAVQAKAENHQAQRQGEEEEEDETGGVVQARVEAARVQRQGEGEEEEDRFRTKSPAKQMIPMVHTQLEEGEEQGPVRARVLSERSTPWAQGRGEEEEEPIHTKGGTPCPEPGSDTRSSIPWVLAQPTLVQPMIQRDLAIRPPRPTATGRTLSAAKMIEAIDYNNRVLGSIPDGAAVIRMIRDVLGISPAPAVVDADFVNAVLDWQAMYRLTQDGKLGPASARRLFREIGAEGEGQGKVISGPRYSPQVPRVAVAGGRKSTSFRFNAEFESDPAKGIFPSCCEVRQFIRWNPAAATSFAAIRGAGNPVPHAGFPAAHPANSWIEDRDAANKRYGHRSGPFSDPQSFDQYLDSSGRRNQAYGHIYRGGDRPGGPAAMAGQWLFLVKVVDVCRGGRTIGAQDVIRVNW